jgi:hypothetical protein
MNDLKCSTKKEKCAPIPGAEYIFLFSEAYKPDTHELVNVLQGTIVTDVFQEKDSGYIFKVKGTDKFLKCFYAWAFAENTSENIEKIKKYSDEYPKFIEYKKLIDSLRNEIITLLKK